MAYFFFLCGSFSSSLCKIFDGTSFNTDEVLSINLSANAFVYFVMYFKVHHKGWLIHSGTLIDLENSDIIFLFQTTLLKWLTFLLESLNVTLTVLLCWIYVFLLTLVFVPRRLSLHWVILIMLLSQFSLTFFQTVKGMPIFVSQLMTIFVLIETIFVII